MTDGYRLGVDFGTSNTAAVVSETGGRTRTLLFDGFPLLPSSVCLDPSGVLMVGRDAAHAARAYPDRFEPNPKQRVDDGSVLLGGAEIAVDALFAAVFDRVAAEATRTVGGGPAEVWLTYPAAWGASRRGVLLAAAARAGLGQPGLLPEPVAAARYFVEVAHRNLSAGSCLVVYDFGAGTFDASVVRRTAQGFDVVAAEGLPDAGGLDVDAALMAYLAAVYGQRYPDAWLRLEQPGTPADRRARRLLWDDVRTAKEVLSRGSSTYVHLPLVEEDAPLGREQVERLARPIVDRTVIATRAAIRAAGVDQRTIAAVFLVGGSSRMPLVATLLHRALGVAPTAIEQPELVVAEGSVRTAPDGAGRPSYVDNQLRSPAIGRARPPVARVAAGPADTPADKAADTADTAADTAEQARTPLSRRLIAAAGAVFALLVVVGWLASDPLARAYLQLGWVTVISSAAVLGLPAYVAWLGGVPAAGSPGRAVVHTLAVALGFVVAAGITRPLLVDAETARPVPALACVAGGVALVVRAVATRAPAGARSPARRWIGASLGLGAAVGAGVMAYGPSKATVWTETMSSRVGEDPTLARYYLAYLGGVACLVALAAAAGAGLARVGAGRSARWPRTLRIVAGVLLTAAGLAVNVARSYGLFT